MLNFFVCNIKNQKWESKGKTFVFLDKTYLFSKIEAVFTIVLFYSFFYQIKIGDTTCFLELFYQGCLENKKCYDPDNFN